MNGIQEVRSSNLLTSTEPGAYFVYILQSLTTGRFYIGSCEHLLQRFRQHQAGYNKATRNRGPWWMPYCETHPTRSAAQQREYQLKRMKNHRRIRALILRSYPMIEVP